MIKSITIIILSLIIVLMAVIFNAKITQLEQDNALITQGKPAKPAAKSAPQSTAREGINQQALELLDSQLIKYKSRVEELEQKITLNSAGSSVLKDEMQQNKESKQVIKSLKSTIDETEKELSKTTDDFNNVKIALEDVISGSDYKKLQELESIVKVFRNKNQKIIRSNIKRIDKLKEASGDILITGAILPVIGAATLLGYAAKEIEHYCQNIKDNIALEKQLFGAVSSLDEKSKKDYREQCKITPEAAIIQGI